MRSLDQIEACRILRISLAGLRIEIAAGRVRPIRLGRLTRFDLAELANWSPAALSQLKGPIMVAKNPNDTSAAVTEPAEAGAVEAPTARTGGRRLDLSRLRADNAEVAAPLKKELTALPLRAPKRGEYFRVNPNVHAEVSCHVFEHRAGMSSEWFLIDRDLIADMRGMGKPVVLHLAANRFGEFFVWPVPEPGLYDANSRGPEKRQAAQDAKRKWLAMYPSQAAMIVQEANNQAVPVTWPDIDAEQMVLLAFSDRHIVDSVEHELLAEIAGA